MREHLDQCLENQITQQMNRDMTCFGEQGRVIAGRAEFAPFGSNVDARCDSIARRATDW